MLLYNIVSVQFITAFPSFYKSAEAGSIGSLCWHLAEAFGHAARLHRFHTVNARIQAILLVIQRLQKLSDMLYVFSSFFLSLFTQQQI